jgi:AraC-like DNA-binding protein
MSDRTFARRSRAQTGRTPAEHVELLRVETAKTRLQSTDESWPGLHAPAASAPLTRCTARFAAESAPPRISSAADSAAIDMCTD